MNLLIVNQYFPPDRSATAILLGQLASDLSLSLQVVMLCGQPTYAPEKEWFIPNHRIRVIRIFQIQKCRSNFAIRLTNYLLFAGGACIQSMQLPKFDVVMCWTDPPIVGLVGVWLKITKKSKLLFVSQDVYPEIVVAMNKMNHVVVRKILHLASRIILQTSDVIVAIGHDMKQKLLFKKCCETHQIVVIPNWSDLHPSKSKSYFRQHLKYSPDQLIVMHSGNIGYSQDFETLLFTAEFLQSHPMIQFVIAGDGGRKKDIENFVKTHHLHNVKLLPYQPTSVLAEFLEMADIHYVSLFPQLVGYIVPSKIYSVLCVARPIVAVLPKNSEIAHIVKQAKCGFVMPRESQKLATLFLKLQHKKDLLLQLGKNGYCWAEKFATRKKACESYLKTIQTLHHSLR